MAALLNAQLNADGHGPGGQYQVDCALDIVAAHGRVLDEAVDRHAHQNLSHFLEPGGARLDELMRLSAASQDNGEYRRQQEGVGTRTKLQMKIGNVGGFGATWIDHEDLTHRVLLDLVDQIARVAEPMRHPRIASQDHKQIAMFDIFRG